MSHHATARQRAKRGRDDAAHIRDDDQLQTATDTAVAAAATTAANQPISIHIETDNDDDNAQAAAAASAASVTSIPAVASPCRPQRRAAVAAGSRMRALAIEQSQPLRHIQLTAASAAASATSSSAVKGNHAGPSNPDESMHDDGRDERKEGSDDGPASGGGSDGDVSSDADSDSDTGAVDADEEQSASESPPPTDDDEDYSTKPRGKAKAHTARRSAVTASTPPRRYMKRPVSLSKAECKSAEREHFGKLTATKKGSTAWALFDNVAAAAQARKKKAEAIAAAACAVSATSSTGDTPAASSCKRRSGHVTLFASASSPPLVDAASSQPLSLPMSTAKRARREQADTDRKEDEFESASSAAASVHERCAKRRRRNSSNAADTPPRQEGSESEGEEEEELMAEDANGIETASSGAAAAAAASSTPAAAVEADPADSMIMQLIDIADDASRSGVFAAVLELSEQRLAHIINLQSSKDGSTFLQRLYRCFALRHSQSIHAHMAKLTRVIKKHADWSLTDEHHSTLLHTLSDAATYQYKTRHWNRNRYRWIDNHMVLQPDEPEYVFRDHDENRSRGFTFDLIRIACDNKLDLISADDKGVIPLMSFPRLVLENKISASRFCQLLLSRPPFDWHYRDADGRTLLHVFFLKSRVLFFHHFHPARRFINRLASDKWLLRQLDLLAGDKDGHSLISRIKQICGELSPVPMDIMRAWQFERAATTRRILCDWMIPDLANLCFEYALGVPVRDKRKFTDEAEEAIFRVRATAERMEAERVAAAAAAEAAGQPAAAAAPAQPAHPHPPPHAAEFDFDSDMSGDEWEMLADLYEAEHHHVGAEAIVGLDEDDEAADQPAAAAAVHLAPAPAPAHAHAHTVHRSRLGSIDAYLIPKTSHAAHAAAQSEGDDELIVLDHNPQSAGSADHHPADDPHVVPPAAPAVADDEPVPMDIE